MLRSSPTITICDKTWRQQDGGQPGQAGEQRKVHVTGASPRFLSIAASELVTGTLQFCCVSLIFIVF